MELRSSRIWLLSLSCHVFARLWKITGGWRPKMPPRSENLINGNSTQRWETMCFKLKVGTGDFIVAYSQDGKYILLPVKMMSCWKWLPGGPWWEFRGGSGLSRSRTQLLPDVCPRHWWTYSHNCASCLSTGVLEPEESCHQPTTHTSIQKHE